MANVRGLLLTLVLASSPSDGWVDQGQLRGPLPLTSWKSLRDQGIHKQRWDFSCGAASLATLLSAYYGIETDEMLVLSLMDVGDDAASFEDMAKVVRRHYGLEATGYAASLQSLQSLAAPALVYLKIGQYEHFSVLRGVDDEGFVWLADPSWGNRILTPHQFASYWSTRDDPVLVGRLLLINSDSPTTPDYFVTEQLQQHIRRSSCRNCDRGLL